MSRFKGAAKTVKREINVLRRVGSVQLQDDVHDVLSAVRTDDPNGIRWAVLGYHAERKELHVLATGTGGVPEMGEAFGDQLAGEGKEILHGLIRAKSGVHMGR